MVVKKKNHDLKTTSAFNMSMGNELIYKCIIPVFVNYMEIE